MRLNQDWPLFAVDFILGKSQWFKAWMSLTKPKSMRDLNYFSSGVKKKNAFLLVDDNGNRNFFCWGVLLKEKHLHSTNDVKKNS